MGHFPAHEIAQGRTNGREKAKRRVGRSAGTSRLGNQECAGEPQRNEHCAYWPNFFAPNQRNADDDKKGRYLENCRDITDGHMFERQNKTSDGENFKRGTKQYPGIDDAVNVTAVTQYEDQGQAPEGGRHAAH